jgi:hypothetical protein
MVTELAFPAGGLGIWSRVSQEQGILSMAARAAHWLVYGLHHLLQDPTVMPEDVGEHLNLLPGRRLTERFCSSSAN